VALIAREGGCVTVPVLEILQTPANSGDFIHCGNFTDSMFRVAWDGSVTLSNITILGSITCDGSIQATNATESRIGGTLYLENLYCANPPWLAFPNGIEAGDFQSPSSQRAGISSKGHHWQRDEGTPTNIYYLHLTNGVPYWTTSD
jgi:hypothetical protein